MGFFSLKQIFPTFLASRGKERARDEEGGGREEAWHSTK